MYFRSDPGSFRKAWLMSKWTLVFIFVWCVQVHAGVYAQNKNLIHLSMKEVGVKDVLWEIEKQTSFVFMYNAGDLDEVGKVNISISTDKVEDVLKKCLEGSSLTFVIQDAVVVVKPIQQVQTAKQIKIKGKVTDIRRVPLPGTTIIVSIGKNGRPVIGTTTDSEGRYQLIIPEEIKDFMLYFSFIGMKTQQVKYIGQETINMVMTEDKKEMEEVVVTGYANIKKSSFTGNVTTVTKKELLKINNKSVLSALQAFDPSFRIKENNLWGSDPNALPEFTIRGESSIGGERGLDEKLRREQRTTLQGNPNLPVFILDGFEVSVQKIYDMDINRIESMTILKDAAATAMYGSRAANGVVVVTSVAPKPGELQINYTFTGGADFPDLSDYNLCNAVEKLEVERLAGYYTAQTEAGQAVKDAQYNQKLQKILKGVNTDWMSQPLRNVFNHKHSLNLSGGVESIRYGIDLNYDSNNGVMKDSRRSRYGAGLTLDYRNKSWLQIMNSVTFNATRSEDSPYGDFSLYTTLQPYAEIFGEDGKLLKIIDNGTTDKTNPIWAVKNLNSYNGRSTNNDITNNFSLNLYFLKGFQFKGQFSITKNDSQTETFVDPQSPAFDNLKDENYIRKDDERGSLSRFSSQGYNWNINTMLYFNRAIHKHFINATVGMNVQQTESSSTSVTYKGFQVGTMSSPAFAAKIDGEKPAVSNSESRLIGFLASVNYSYDNIYLFDGSFRYDASSQFGRDKRWAPFWSVGVGINIHNYSFLKDNPIINNLKIRASYGSTGKNNFPNYAAVTTYQMATDDWYWSGPAASLKYLGNPRLSWETTNTLDAGFTISLFQDLIYLDASYYHKETKDLIDEVSVRTSSGFDSYKTNAGAMLNEGFEINVSVNLFRNKDWNVMVNANLASNKNKITKLGADLSEANKKTMEEFLKERSDYKELLSSPVILYYEGASKTAIYAVRSVGIDPANGKERFIRKNGMSTYTWDPNDQVVVGDENPDASGNVGLNVGWKGVFLNANFSYQWGAQTYNSTLLNKVENANILGGNVDKRVLTQRWNKAGDLAPYYDIEDNSQTNPTSRFVQDYNYFNFSSLCVGYDFRQELIRKIRLSALGIRFNMNDICRWSTVKEERGLGYPYSRSFSFSLNVSF